MKQRLEFIDKVKDSLLARRDELNNLISRMASEDSREIGQVKDSADEALSVTMDQLQNSIQEAEIDQLKLIDEALARIEKNEYGICIDCGDPINVKRLEVYPFASRCISCQEASEE